MQNCWPPHRSCHHLNFGKKEQQSNSDLVDVDVLCKIYFGTKHSLNFPFWSTYRLKIQIKGRLIKLSTALFGSQKIPISFFWSMFLINKHFSYILDDTLCIPKHVLIPFSCLFSWTWHSYYLFWTIYQHAILKWKTFTSETLKYYSITLQYPFVYIFPFKS